MANLNIKFNNKNYSIDSASLADATAALEAHLMDMMEERLEGDGAEFHKFAPAALTFRSTAPLNELQEVQINGVTVDPSNYITEEGSTVITLPIEYLKTLDANNYEISVVSASKSVSGGFSVVEPELNEHSFYYNQPYANYMDYFNSDLVIFIREDNTMDIMVVANDATETAEWTFTDGTLTITSPSMGELHCTFSADGMELYNTELGATLGIDENETYAADEDYMYIYKEDLGGYEVKCIDKTKAEYGAIKTGINGIKTVALEQRFLEGNNKITIIPSIPDGINIRYCAFSGCNGLTEVTIPSGVTIIENNAFSACANLNRVEIPASVINISQSAFSNCDNLNSIIVDDYNAIYSSLDGVLLNKNRSDLIVCPEGKTGTYIIPNGITSIGNEAFSSCDNLTSVIISDGVTSIGGYAFSSCGNLTSLTISNSVKSIGAEVFNNCLNLGSITYTGTIEQWNAITITGFGAWERYVPATHVHCIDGDVAL